MEEERKAIPKLINIVEKIENIMENKNDHSNSEKTSDLKITVMESSADKEAKNVQTIFISGTQKERSSRKERE